jgi:DNA-3-methyladenine glycosylase
MGEVSQLRLSANLRTELLMRSAQISDSKAIAQAESNSEFIPLPQTFYEPSAELIASRLLGHWLIRRMPAGLCGGPIVETEAYLMNDPACHAYGGRTPRNRVMWGQPGFAYVYLIYGYHFCVNAVCCGEGVAEAVLIRAIQPTIGLEQMRGRRSIADLRHLTNGPAKLCEAMAIDRTLDGANLFDLESPLFIAANPHVVAFRERTGPVLTSKRIGITKAAEVPLRFFLAGSPFVSRGYRKPSSSQSAVP